MRYNVNLVVFLSLILILISSCVDRDNDTNLNSSAKMETVYDIDKNEYNLVNIGTQVWMNTNLNVSHFRNGDTIPEAKSAEDFEKYSEQAMPAWRYNSFDPDLNISGKFNEFGKLYNWYAVNDPRGLAPQGSHIPSQTEWNELIEYLGTNAAQKLKDTIWWSQNRGTNQSGFSAVPGGGGGIIYEYLGSSGIWWTSTENKSNSEEVEAIQITEWTDRVRKIAMNKNFAYSVRCIWK